MGDKPEHLKWLVDTRERLTTADEKTVEVWEFRHQPDEAVLSAWAKHFRNHYCSDDQIDELIENTEFKTHADYLVKIKFPDEKKAPGPSIRAGDFGEILIADFLEYILGFHVPRTRYIDRTVRNESTRDVTLLDFALLKMANGLVVMHWRFLKSKHNFQEQNLPRDCKMQLMAL